MERPAGEAAPRPTTPARVRRARIGPEATMRGWASGLEPMTTETRWSRTWSHLGILISITALVIYVTWRVVFTLPPVGWNLVAAWLLIAFEAFPVIGLIIRAVTLWNLDTPGARSGDDGLPRASSRRVHPDVQRTGRGDRADHRRRLRPGAGAPDLGAGRRRPALGGRALQRATAPATCAGPSTHHAKAGNMNHALELMAREKAEGGRGHRRDRRAGLRPRAAAPLPDGHAGLVRRPRDRPGPGAADLLQRRRLRRRRRHRASRACSSTCCCRPATTTAPVRSGAGPPR